MPTLATLCRYIAEISVRNGLRTTTGAGHQKEAARRAVSFHVLGRCSDVMRYKFIFCDAVELPHAVPKAPRRCGG